MSGLIPPSWMTNPPRDQGRAPRLTVRVRWAWYDLWVGAYWDRRSRVLYVCPLPTLVIEFRAGGY